MYKNNLLSQLPDITSSNGILAEDVTVTYPNGHTALWNASFEIPRGTVTALVLSLIHI